MTEIKRPSTNPRITMPGIYDAVPSDEYHAHPSISSSQIGDACRSIAHWHANSPFNFEAEPIEPTEAMIQGTAIHCYLLEPDVFDKEYMVQPSKADYPGLLDTKEDLIAHLEWMGSVVKKSLKKADLIAAIRAMNFQDETIIWDEVMATFNASAVGKKIVTADERRRYQRMGEALAKQEIEFELEDGSTAVFLARDLFTVGKPEQSIFWRDQGTGLMCRVRVDWLIHTPQLRLIMDYKKTRNADKGPFAGQAAELLYWMRAAFYIDGMREGLRAKYTAEGKAFTEDDLKFDYILLAQEDQRPFLAATYHYPDQFIDYGRELYRAKMKQIALAMAQRHYPGYTRRLRPIEVYQRTLERFPELEGMLNSGATQH